MQSQKRHHEEVAHANIVSETVEFSESILVSPKKVAEGGEEEGKEGMGEEPEFILHVKYYNTMLEWSELISPLNGEALLTPFENSTLAGLTHTPRFIGQTNN